MNVQVSFSRSEQDEINMVIDILVMLTNHFSVSNGFLPVNVRFKGNKKSIYFPNFTNQKYLKITKLLDKIADKFPDIELLDETYQLRKIIKNDVKMHDFDIQNIQHEWNKINDRFFDFFEDIFQVKLDRLELNVIVNTYGVYVAFSKLKIKNKVGRMEIYLREDMGVAEIAEGIISAFFYKNKDIENLTWNEVEAVTDTFLKMTKFSKLFQNAVGTLEIIRSPKDDSELFKISKRFLEQIGYHKEKNLVFSENMIYINGNIPIYNFSPMETKILKLLLERNKKVCSYLDIGDVIWEDPDQFSIWTISTLIHRIRHKLQKNGLSGDCIKTYRGKGFILEI